MRQSGRSGRTRRLTSTLAGAMAIGLALATPQDTGAQAPSCDAVSAGSQAPVDSAIVTVGDQQIKTCYSARTAGNEPVFGHSLEYTQAWTVEYDTLWRTGIVFQTPVAVELAGISLDPGVYGVYAIPSSFEWTIILSDGVDAYLVAGAYDDAARASEVGRALVRSSSLRDRVERLSVRGEVTGTSSSDLVLEWDHTQVRVPLRLAATRGALACELRGAPDRLAQRASPPDSLDIRIGGRTARLCYGRPSARERRIFGGLLPYDDMWRTGANEPTVLHIPFAAEVAGIPVEPGDYVLATLPSPGEWVVVINAATNRWGRVTPTERGSQSSYTDAVRAQEVGRAMVSSERTEQHVEMFTVTANAISGSLVELVLAWERTQVRIPIRVLE
jgi:hypothetical protein